MTLVGTCVAHCPDGSHLHGDGPNDIRPFLIHARSRMSLRRIVCTCVIVVPALTGLSPARGQSPPARIGITAGMNSSTFAGIDATNPTPTPLKRFIGGVVLIVPRGPNWAVESGLLFTMKGAEEKSASGDGIFRMSYIQLPILLRYDFSGSGTVRPFVLGGWAVSFRTACTLDQTVAGSTSTTPCSQLKTVTKDAQIRTLDYGGIIGGGVAFNVGGKTFSLGARLDHSFDTFEMNADIKHSVLSALASIELPLSR